MVVLVTCKNEEDQIKNEGARAATSFSPLYPYGSKRKAMNRNWSNQKANPALNTKAGNK